MRILVDSSVIIDFLKSNNKRSTKYFQAFQLEKEAQPVISFATLIELYSAVSEDTPRLKKIIDILVNKSEVLDPNKETYILASQIMQQTKNDLAFSIIATQAVLSGLHFLTNQQKLYKDVKGIQFHYLSSEV